MRAAGFATSLAIAVAVGSCTQQTAAGTSAPAPVPGPAPTANQQPAGSGPGGPGGPPMTAADSARLAARRDSIAKDREKLYNEALAKIAGRENQPAESVYKNIKIFQGRPASQLLRIMAQGFDPALGVSCSHCHVVGEYDKEDKPTKQIARDMFAMVNAINTQYLAKIKNLRSPNPSVSCSTCHRGQTRPGGGGGGPPRPANPPG
jgi:photosynthetic reaction center cytochrome c subunit